MVDGRTRDFDGCSKWGKLNRRPQAKNELDKNWAKIKTG